MSLGVMPPRDTSNRRILGGAAAVVGLFGGSWRSSRTRVYLFGRTNDACAEKSRVMENGSGFGLGLPSDRTLAERSPKIAHLTPARLPPARISRARNGHLDMVPFSDAAAHDDLL